MRLFRASNWLVRAAETLKERYVERGRANRARDERAAMREVAMVVVCCGEMLVRATEEVSLDFSMPRETSMPS